MSHGYAHRRELLQAVRDRGHVLLTLHQRWYARFAAQLDALLEEQPADLADAVRELWASVTADDPTGQVLLDAYRTHPAVAAPEERQRLCSPRPPPASYGSFPTGRSEPTLSAA